ncbi:MAG: hypothetical protein ABIH25_02065 [Candidatus Woesearchaeota archaeon]
MDTKKRFLLGGIVFIIFLISISFVNAASNVSYSSSKGFDWLYNKTVDKDWELSTDALAFTILALRNEGYDVTNGIAELKDQESNDHWDSISSSALATLTLWKEGNDVDDNIEWLLDEQFTALSDGRWLIQFLVNDEEGQCKVTYDGDTFEFIINGTDVSTDDCYLSDPNWVDFEECIKGNSADLNESMDISCFLGGVSPSILFRTYNNEYYIVDEDRPFVIENGCFGSGHQCSCTDTAFAAWSLDLMREDTYSEPYLRSQCHDAVVELSLLYLVTGESISRLVDLQKSDGSFDGDEFQTAIAYMALKKGNGAAASEALEWLKFKQRDDGSWGGDILTTSVVLYAAFSRDLGQTDGDDDDDDDDDDGDEGGEGDECTINDDCNIGFTCRYNKCTPNSQAGCSKTDDCVLKEDCSNKGYEYDCTPDCVCVAGDLPPGRCNSDIDCVGSNLRCDLFTNTCVNKDQKEPECRTDSECQDGYECNIDSGDCEKKDKGSGIVWLIVGIIVLVAAIAFYFAYNKFFKGKFGKGKGVYKPVQPSYPMTRQRVPARSAAMAQPRMQPRPQRSGAETALEKQLDESLKKARELLRKDKK